MRILVIQPGRKGKTPAAALCSDYQRRLRRYGWESEERLLRPAPLGRETPAEIDRSLAAEARSLARVVGPADSLVALDRRGEALSSLALAERLAAVRARGRRRLVLVLGGSHGLADDLLHRAEWVWSFGPLTLPHDLARVVVWEQLYRAATILAGHPYHK